MDPNLIVVVENGACLGCLDFCHGCDTYCQTSINIYASHLLAGFKELNILVVSTYTVVLV